MSIFTPLDNFVKKEFKALSSFLASPTVKNIESELDQALNFALPIAEEFAASGYVPAKVVVLMAKYAIPVADGLANGSITAMDEIKQLVGAGLKTLIQKNHGLSGTLATIVSNIAYAHVNPSVVSVTPVTPAIAAPVPTAAQTVAVAPVTATAPAVAPVAPATTAAAPADKPATPVAK